MKKCLIRQPAGLGDILFCQKISTKLIQDGYEVWWPVDNEYQWLSDYIKDINFCSIDDDFPFKSIYNSREYKNTSDNVFLPLQSADTYYPGMCMMDAKYKSIGLEYSDWSDYLKFNRHKNREDELFKLLDLPDNFTLVNRFFTSPPQACKHINIEKLDNVVEVRHIPGFTLFDWCKVFEKAAEIHTVDTSILFILETLDITDKLFCYSRFDTPNFNNVSHLFSKLWHYVNDPQLLDLKSVVPKILGTSQKGQDSYIDYIFKNIGTTNRFFVEFGAVDGIISSNTYYLRTAQQWQGLLLEGDDSITNSHNPSINLYNEKLTKDNICNVFSKYNVPINFDFLSIDIDGNDFWLLLEILKNYNPRVIMIESCVRFPPDVVKVQKYDSNFIWRGDRWYGASPLALKKLGEKFGYTAVHIHLDDLILIQDKYLNQNNLNPDWSEVYPAANPELYSTHGDYNIVEDQWVEPII